MACLPILGQAVLGCSTIGTDLLPGTSICDCCSDTGSCCRTDPWPTTVYLDGSFSAALLTFAGITTPIAFTYVSGDSTTRTIIYTATTPWDGPGDVSWTLVLQCCSGGACPCEGITANITATADAYAGVIPPCPTPPGPINDSILANAGETCTCNPLALVFNFREFGFGNSNIIWCLTGFLNTWTFTISE